MAETRIIFPAEWHKQDIIQMAWPDEQTDWSYILDEVRACYISIIKEITEQQKLLLVCRSVEEAKKSLNNVNTGNIIFAQVPINDTWTRDFGGITIFENDKPTILDFQFNGWGGKFPADLDNNATEKLFAQNIFSCVRKNMKHLILEGGSIDSNGEGAILTTEQCLLNKNRNPYLTKQTMTDELKKLFGGNTIHWLKHGFLEGDDTDSHVDTLARFANANTILYVQCNDKNDKHYRELNIMEEEIQSLKSVNGNKYNCIPLPMTKPVFDGDGNRLPATYANFLIVNEAVLVPTYDNATKDNQALGVFREVFPQKKVVGINCTALIMQHGSLHCITMQYPKGVLYLS